MSCVVSGGGPSPLPPIGRAKVSQRASGVCGSASSVVRSRCYCAIWLSLHWGLYRIVDRSLCQPVTLTLTQDMAQQDKERISPNRSAGQGKQKAALDWKILWDFNWAKWFRSVSSAFPASETSAFVSCITALTYPDALSNLLLFLFSSLYSVQVHSLLLKLIGKLELGVAHYI
jgi:hypothetical protein